MYAEAGAGEGEGGVGAIGTVGVVSPISAAHGRPGLLPVLHGDAVSLDAALDSGVGGKGRGEGRGFMRHG